MYVCMSVWKCVCVLCFFYFTSLSAWVRVCLLGNRTIMSEIVFVCVCVSANHGLFGAGQVAVRFEDLEIEDKIGRDELLRTSHLA